MPRFSIIIPVYNAERYLDECIQSVMRQKHPDFELLLVNDGSTDGSGAVCDGWAGCDPRIRTLHKANGGSASARNLALTKITGEYVLFLDSDDYWMADDILERLDRRLCQTEPDVLVYNLQKEYEGKREDPYFSDDIVFPPVLSPEESAKRIAFYNLWTACAWNKAVRACFFEGEQLRFEEGNTSEDIDWTLRLALAVRRFDYVNVCAVNYRQRLGSITGSTTPQKIRQLLENVRKCGHLVETAKDDRPMLRPYTAYQYGTLLYNIAMLSAADAKDLLPQAKEMAYLLDWSDYSKIRLLRQVKRLLGFSLMLKLLHLKGALSKIRMRRSD